MGPEFNEIMFQAELDHCTGNLKWSRCRDPEGALIRTIAMSQMTSMLRDYDRNSVYESALKAAIEYFGNKMHVSPTLLDIGTGTGLLALCGARHGATVVVGCEMFQRLAHIANKVVQDNGFEQTVHIVACNSNTLDCDRMDLLVSELLDSSLLGEGVLSTHADAIDRLIHISYDTYDYPLSDRVLPHSAEMFATLIECPVVNHMQAIHNICMPNISPFRDDSAMNCLGGRRLIPVHWNILDNSFGGKSLSNYHKIFNFEFFHSLDTHASSSTVRILVSSDGIVHGVMLWWKLYLLSPTIDPDRKCFYTTEPGKQNWQDHWLQVVYPLPEPIPCNEGDEAEIIFRHNGLHIWVESSLLIPKTSKMNTLNGDTPDYKRARIGGSVVDQNITELSNNNTDYQSKYANEAEVYAHTEQRNEVDLEELSSPPPCTCGWHILYSSERLECLNDAHRSHTWISAIDQIISNISQNDLFFGQEKFILDVSDGSYLSLALAGKLRNINNNDNNNCNDYQIISMERKQFSKILHDQIIEANSIENIMTWDGDDWNDVIDYYKSNEYDENVDMNDNTTFKKLAKIEIHVILCECYFFQLHAQPTWQALSFLDSVRSLRARCSKDVVICPCRARLMAVAVELGDLGVGRGMVGRYDCFVIICKHNAMM